MRKRLFAFLMTSVMIISMCAGMVTPSFADEKTFVVTSDWENPFTDVSKSDWYYDSVSYARQSRLLYGTSDTTFEPNVTMTRAMLISVLHRLNGSPMPTDSNPFSDVPQNQWYTDAVIWAASNGLTAGISKTEFAPNASLTREQMVTFFYNYAQDLGYNVNASASLQKYSDSKNISSYAIEAFQWAVDSNIIYGTSDTKLSPKSGCTRAQTAAVLQRFIQHYGLTNPSVEYLDTPIISTTKNVSGGVQLTWGSVKNASQYRIFRKTSNTSWSKLADVTSTQFVDTDVKSGTTYIYTIRCISGDGSKYTSAYNSAGSTIMYIPTPVLKSVTLVDNAIKILWDQPIVGVDYQNQVYRKSGNSEWKLIAETGNAFYVDTKVNDGTTYVYTVRRVATQSGYASDMDATGLSITYGTSTAVAEITTAESSDGQIRLGWDRVSGVSRYRVFYKNSSGNWIKLDDTGLSRITIDNINGTALKSGTSYTFTVRCITLDGNSYIGDYDHTGTTIQAVGEGTFKLDSNGKYNYYVNNVFQTNANGVFYGSINGENGLWYVENGALCTNTYSHTPFIAAVGYVGNNGTAYRVTEGTGAAIEYKDLMLSLINQERAAAGLNPVVLDDELTEIAEIRAEDIVLNFSHLRPNGKSWYTLFNTLGIDCSSIASEILSQNYGECENTMYGWMHSSGHKEIVLGKDFTRVGIAYVYDPTDNVYGYHWSVIFDK